MLHEHSYYGQPALIGWQNQMCVCLVFTWSRCSWIRSPVFRLSAAVTWWTMYPPARTTASTGYRTSWHTEKHTPGVRTHLHTWQIIFPRVATPTVMMSSTFHRQIISDLGANNLQRFESGCRFCLELVQTWLLKTLMGIQIAVLHWEKDDYITARDDRPLTEGLTNKPAQKWQLATKLTFWTHCKHWQKVTLVVWNIKV